jgi:hypothetical protein
MSNIIVAGIDHQSYIFFALVGVLTSTAVRGVIIGNSSIAVLVQTLR